MVERDYQPCFECHKPMHESDYVFSFDALSEAAGDRAAGGAWFADRAPLPSDSRQNRVAHTRIHQVRRSGGAHSLEPRCPLD